MVETLIRSEPASLGRLEIAQVIESFRSSESVGWHGRLANHGVKLVKLGDRGVLSRVSTVRMPDRRRRTSYLQSRSINRRSIREKSLNHGPETRGCSRGCCRTRGIAGGGIKVPHIPTGAGIAVLRRNRVGMASDVRDISAADIRANWRPRFRGRPPVRL